MNRFKLLSGALAIALLPLLVSCGPGMVVYAQSLPATLHATVQPRPAGENVVKYQLIVDGGTPIDVTTTLDTVNCSPGCIRTAFTVATFGAHSTVWRAANLQLSTDPTSFRFSPNSVTVAFTLNQDPSAPVGGTVTQ